MSFYCLFYCTSYSQRVCVFPFLRCEIFLNSEFSERPPTVPHPTQCDITFLNLNTVKELQITKEVNSPAEVTLQKLDTNMVSLDTNMVSSSRPLPSVGHIHVRNFELPCSWIA